MKPSNKIKVIKLIEEIDKKGFVNEIVINERDKIFIEQGSSFTQLAVKLSLNDLLEFVDYVAQLNQRPCDANNPIFNGVLEDGSRINIVMPPFTAQAPAITIRKFREFDPHLSSQMSNFGGDQMMINFFKALVRSRANLLISGGTSSGKTSFMNTLLSEVHPNQRLVVIEDIGELRLSHQNCVRLELLNSSNPSQSISLADLVKNSLRMRPDRIIIGEVRGEEVKSLIESMNTGHNGAMTTIHSNSSLESLSKIESLFPSSQGLSRQNIKEQIKMAINYIIQTKRVQGGNRVISEVREVTGLDGAQINTQLIAKYDENKLQLTGLTPSGAQALYKSGLDQDFFNL